MTGNYVLSGTSYSKWVFFDDFMFQIMFPEFMREKFRNFDESSMAGLPKLHFTCPEQCFLEISFVAKFVFIYSVFDFQEKQLWLPEKIFVRVLGKKLYEFRWSVFGEKLFLNNFKFLLLDHFRTLSGKKLNFWRWIIGKVKECNLLVQRNDFMKTIVFWKK